MKTKILILVLVLICLCPFVYGQTTKGKLTVIKHIPGIIVYNKSYFKHFAVLMQDTTLGRNRFDGTFEKAHEVGYVYNFKDTVLLPVVIIDSNFLVKNEEKLLQKDSSVVFCNYSKDNLKKKLKKYIHLYIGYIKPTGHISVVVQIFCVLIPSLKESALA